MAQFARPLATTTAGSWVYKNAASIHAAIDETSSDTADYAYAPTLEDPLRVSLTSVTDPGVDTGMVVRCTAKAQAAHKITVSLIQGASTVIDTWEHVGTGAVASYSHNVAAVDVANITDYSDLFIEIEASSSAVGETTLLAAGSYGVLSAEIARVAGGGMFTMTNLTNLRSGIFSSYEYISAQRFIATETGTPTSFITYWIAAAGGYSGGNGGSILCEIWPDNGSGLPDTSGSAICSYTYVPALTAALFTGSSFDGGNYTPTLTWTTAGALTQGVIYHLMYTNVDANPSVNWISVDNFLDFNGVGSRYIDGAGWSANHATRPSPYTGAFTWIIGAEESAPRIPNLIINMPGGGTIGWFGGAETANVYPTRTPQVTSSRPVRSKYIIGSASNTVVGVEVNAVFDVAGDLLVEVLDSDGSTVLASSTITQGTSNRTMYDADTITFTNYRILFPSAATIGTTFYVRYTPQGSAVCYIDCARDFRNRAGFGQSSPSGSERYDGTVWEHFDQNDGTNWDGASSASAWSDIVHFGLPWAS